ncbi:hypothetical protein YPC_2146 [Yersinia pestis biovar Medievalis str. Harbin 35]|nr:hypothetical protein YPC_2146 [Yersinia pestis biovar Medievalis str. Harbin 35]EEO80864.1 hypothetical protein YPF_2659 [Yersinia pestis biovar Orientalis str. India 195]EEO83971.1 hypothetical protein YPH_4618 [Yersinia pestis biovar Orientalis str. PEXU2]EEO90333.1 hypothetical protein YPS_2620 [Yersinia pestis Pestoides A]
MLFVLRFDELFHTSGGKGTITSTLLRFANAAPEISVAKPMQLNSNRVFMIYSPWP